MQDEFSTIETEGILLPPDFLARISKGDKEIEGLRKEDYHLSGDDRLADVISQAWSRAKTLWSNFKKALESLPESDKATTVTRERWLLPLFQELGYGRLVPSRAQEIEGKSYPVSHIWQRSPIHLIGCRLALDERTPQAAGAARMSPHSMVQEFLNRSDDHLWGFVSNGLTLRILRDNASITRQAYVEFDLQAMLEEDDYSDFSLFWLLCHQSRVEGELPAQCWLEKWSQTAQKDGTRALEDLRIGVEQAIVALGSGFLAHPANNELKEKLRTGALDKQEYYHQLLRTVYRLIFLFVAEDRGVLLDPKASHEAQRRYEQFYSTRRLRKMAEKSRSTKHHDLWEGLALVIDKLHATGCVEIGLPALGSFLWSSKATPDLSECKLQNQQLLDAFRHLSFTEDATAKVLRSVDYKNLGAEEFGSVYEALLELHPDIHADIGMFELKTAAGNERKTTGSYYTPTSLINCLLDSALDPVLDEASKKPQAESAILNLKVCDPACGSGHFLVAAAHRIAKRLARARTGDEEPSPAATRKALRDVIGHCVYGVDLNPWAVELCKFSLWLDALEPGKPLSFLEHHIQCGNSLLGATPALLQKGVPDDAFETMPGDDKKYCTELKKKNKNEREEKGDLFDADQPWNRLGDLAAAMVNLEAMPDDTPEYMSQKQQRYENLLKSTKYENGRLWADAWCSAFVWKKVREKDKGLPFALTERYYRNIEHNPHSVPQWMKDEVTRLSRQYQFFHWHIAFPEVFQAPTRAIDDKAMNNECGWSGGFHVVLGNPPWERMNLEAQQFFSISHPEIASALTSKRRELIETLAIKEPKAHSAFMDAQRLATASITFCERSGVYNHINQARLNTYVLFVELSPKLLNALGRCGLIVPSGVATDDTCRKLFDNIISNRSLVSLFDFENREAIFQSVHRSYKFCLLTLSARPVVEKARFIFFASNMSHLLESEREFSLSNEDITLLSPITRLCPTFRTNRDKDIVRAIYERVPPFIRLQEQRVDWIDSDFLIMFRSDDSSQHYQQFSESQLTPLMDSVTTVVDGKPYVPIWESKLIHQFDHRFATFGGVGNHDLQAGNARQFTDLERERSSVSVPRYWALKSLVDSILLKRKWHFEWYLAYRDITNATNERTAIAVCLPRAGAMQPLNLFLPETPWHALVWLSAMNSMVLDFVARQRIGGVHLNITTCRQLPIVSATLVKQHPLVDVVGLRTLELVYTTATLSGFAKDCSYDGPAFKWDEGRRFLLRCELDAAYFHLYGVSREDMAYILDTFPIVKRKEVDKYGEYRTQRVILEIYDEMKNAMDTGVAYKARLVSPPADSLAAHPPKLPAYAKVQVERGKTVAYITLLLHVWKKRVARDVLDTSLVLLLNDDIRKSLAGEKVKLDPETRIALSLDSTLANMKANRVVQIDVSGTQQHIALGNEARPLSEFPSSMQDCAREALAVYLKLRDADQLAYLERVLNDKSVLVQDGAATV